MQLWPVSRYLVLGYRWPYLADNHIAAIWMLQLARILADLARDVEG